MVKACVLCHGGELIGCEQRVHVPASTKPVDHGFCTAIADRASEVVAQQEESPGPNELGTLREETLGISPVDKRLDGVGQVSGVLSVGQLKVVAFHATDPVRQSRVTDDLFPTTGLIRVKPIPS